MYVVNTNMVVHVGNANQPIKASGKKFFKEKEKSVQDTLQVY